MIVSQFAANFNFTLANNVDDVDAFLNSLVCSWVFVARRLSRLVHNYASDKAGHALRFRISATVTTTRDPAALASWLSQVMMLEFGAGAFMLVVFRTSAVIYSDLECDG